MMTRVSCFVAVLALASVALAQTEFSAEIVDTQKPGTQAKIYMAKDKMRVEPADKNQRGMGAFIMNLTTQTSTVLMDQQHMYMELPAQTAAQRNPYKFFRTADAENACSDWLQLSWNKGGTCHKVGNETVNGRSTVKYEDTNANGEAGTIWVDPKLRFPVKWQGKNGSGELRNIQEGSQPASLFEIPAGYIKFDMGSMMQRPQ
jgi:outer membrane lipoprotein-sorting protein